MDWEVNSACGNCERIIDFCHIEHRDNAVIVPSAVSKRTTIVAREENNIEVRHVDRRLMSNGKSWLRYDKSNRCIWSCYVQEGAIKDLDEWWGCICGIEPHERVVRAPLVMVCTHDIVNERVNVLN